MRRRKTKKFMNTFLLSLLLNYLAQIWPINSFPKDTRSSKWVIFFIACFCPFLRNKKKVLEACFEGRRPSSEGHWWSRQESQQGLSADGTGQVSQGTGPVLQGTKTK